MHRFNQAVELADHFLGDAWEWAPVDMLIEELLRQGKLALANELRAAAWGIDMSLTIDYETCLMDLHKSLITPK
jgi:hypothetical protein